MAGPEELDARYRAVPFPSGHHAVLDIRALARRAREHGVTPPRVETARVLELGCASGGHLAAMARELPDATFVGIDRVIHQHPDLPNLTLVEGDLSQATGTFDYVLAIGLYSWLPDVRPLMATVARCLGPGALAALTCNALPGWADWMRARDLMRFHTAGFDTPAEQIQQARAILGTLLKTGANPELKPLAEGDHDAWLFHDWIAPHSRCVGMPEVLETLGDLQMVGDAEQQWRQEFVSPTRVRTILLRHGL